MRSVPSKLTWLFKLIIVASQWDIMCVFFTVVFKLK